LITNATNSVTDLRDVDYILTSRTDTTLNNLPVFFERCERDSQITTSDSADEIYSDSESLNAQSSSLSATRSSSFDSENSSDSEPGILEILVAAEIAAKVTAMNQQPKSTSRNTDPRAASPSPVVAQESTWS